MHGLFIHLHVFLAFGLDSSLKQDGGEFQESFFFFGVLEE